MTNNPNPSLIEEDRAREVLAAAMEKAFIGFSNHAAVAAQRARADEVRAGTNKQLEVRAMLTFAEEARVAEQTRIAEVAYKALRDWRLSTMGQEDEPSAGYPLVDAVSTPGTDIGTGEEELREIAHALATAIRKPLV